MSGYAECQVKENRLWRMLHIIFPFPSAHSGNLLKSLADMLSYKPLPEVVSRVVTNSFLSQVNLKLTLTEWVNI